MRSRRNKRRSLRNKRKSFRNKRKSLRHRRKNMKGGFTIIKDLDGKITGINFTKVTGEEADLEELIKDNMATPDLLPHIIYKFVEERGLDGLSKDEQFKIFQFIMSTISKKSLHH